RLEQVRDDLVRVDEAHRVELHEPRVAGDVRDQEERALGGHGGCGRAPGAAATPLLHADDHRDDAFRVDHGVEELAPGDLRQVHDVGRDELDGSGEFVAGTELQ